MQYNPAHSYAQAQHQPYPNWLKYLAAAVLAFVAILGLSTHHVLLVAVGLIAVLAFENRLQTVSDPAPQAAPAKVDRTDGGSFPGQVKAAPTTGSSRPTVIDGGSFEHHNVETQRFAEGQHRATR